MGYSNPQFDALAKKATSELDNTKHLQMWAEAQEIVMTDVPIIPMFYGERLVLVKPAIKGLKTTGMDFEIAGDMFYPEVYLTKYCDTALGAITKTRSEVLLTAGFTENSLRSELG